MAEPTTDEPGSHPGFGNCYRHPDRDSGVRCARCSRPICPTCMIAAPVGFQCPNCVRGGPEVRRLRSLRTDPYATMTLVALNVAAFLPALASGGGAFRRAQPLAEDFALFGPSVAGGEWWRLATSGFLHYGLPHLAFNMLALWFLGSSLEPALGRARFVALYAAGLFGGAAGALLLEPRALTAGASGAVFGLMAAAFVLQRRRGVDPMQSGVGGLLVVNLLFTFALPGISIGGHLGGLVGGALAGSLVDRIDGSRRPTWPGAAAAAAVAVSLAAVGILVAGRAG